MKSFTRFRVPVAWLVVLLLAGAVLVVGPRVGSRSVGAQPANSMSVSAPVGPHDVSPTAAFDAFIDVDAPVNNDYGTVAWNVDWTSNDILDANSITNLSADKTICFQNVLASSANGSCAMPEGANTSLESGHVEQINMYCTAPGTTYLHLVAQSEDVKFTRTIDETGNIPTTLGADAQVVCGVGGPGATPPAATYTPGAGPSLTPPPAGPTATPTPLPEGMEAVALVTGCNSVTSTYGDGSSI